MFDVNEFKRRVKVWIYKNPRAQVAELVDFCEEIIPPAYYASNHWLIDQTVSWFGYMKNQKQVFLDQEEMDKDDFH